MDCAGLREILSDYIEQSLSESAHAEAHKHLRSCADCRAEYESLLLTVKAVRSLAEVPAPPHFLSALNRRLAEEQAPWWKKAVAFLDHGLSALPLRSMTAAAGVILVITIVLVSNNWTGPKHIGFGHDDNGPTVLGSGTDPVPAEFASTNPSAPSSAEEPLFFNTPTEFLMDIVNNDPAWNRFPVYPHPRGAGVIINSPEYVVEVMMDPAEFLIIQTYIEEHGFVMPASLREARSQFPIYIRFLPSPTAPLPLDQ